jgi:hypothetical protein
MLIITMSLLPAAFGFVSRHAFRKADESVAAQAGSTAADFEAVLDAKATIAARIRTFSYPPSATTTAASLFARPGASWAAARQ